MASDALASFIVLNEGVAVLNLTSIALTGVDAGDFQIIAGGAGNTVSPGSSHQIDVLFVPTAWDPAGNNDKNATLSIANNDNDESGRDKQNPRGSGGDYSSTAPVGYDDYDAWGMLLPGRSMATSFTGLDGLAKNKFTGKELDDEFGLDWNYFGARYYDARIGRWLAPDPLAEKYPSLTPYSYVAGNPISRLDPDGRIIRDLAGRIIAPEVTYSRTLTAIRDHFDPEKKAVIDFVGESSTSHDVPMAYEAAGGGLKGILAGLAEAVFPTQGKNVKLGESIDFINKGGNLQSLSTLGVNTEFAGQPLSTTHAKHIGTQKGTEENVFCIHLNRAGSGKVGDKTNPGNVIRITGTQQEDGSYRLVLIEEE